MVVEYLRSPRSVGLVRAHTTVTASYIENAKKRVARWIRRNAPHVPKPGHIQDKIDMLARATRV